MWIYCDDDNISKRHLLISTCCFSKSADSNVWHTHTHTHTHLWAFPCFCSFLSLTATSLPLVNNTCCESQAHTAHHHRPHVGESHVGMLTQQYCARRAHHWQPPLRESDVMRAEGVGVCGGVEDVQEIMGRERRKEVKACAVLRVGQSIPF